jgi:hypothetical protein
MTTFLCCIVAQARTYIYIYMHWRRLVFRALIIYTVELHFLFSSAIFESSCRGKVDGISPGRQLTDPQQVIDNLDGRAATSLCVYSGQPQLLLIRTMISSKFAPHGE